MSYRRICALDEIIDEHGKIIRRCCDKLYSRLLRLTKHRLLAC